MSLILEALRKSEAERRRGSTPDVAMELPPVPAARARATPAWVLPALVIAIFALLAGGWWSQRDTGGDAMTQAAAPAVAEPLVDSPAPPVVVARAETPAAPPATPAPMPPAAAPAPAPAPTAAIAQPAPPPARPLPPPMPAGTREVADIDATSLPPVKLSMHMWDESPARRFVILDGQRMTEGDRSGGLSVVAIERDGVVVERNGQRARVPLP
ncbi:MAG TPA: general secretion pathway protein GspB [Thermomonas sp.]|nr:general secretion pathway protein GspB [Thermomonas sp.]